MNPVIICCITAILGHLLCWQCDCLLTFTPDGVLNLKYLDDNEKLAALFRNLPLKRVELSMLLGVLALFLCAFGFYGLAYWIYPYARICAYIMGISAAVFFFPGIAHHVFCGVIEWFYIKSGCTEQARQDILLFFRRTAVTMVVCYIGLFVFALTLGITIATGSTPLPRLCCLINPIPLFIILTICKVHCAGNLGNALFFLSMLITLLLI